MPIPQMPLPNASNTLAVVVDSFDKLAKIHVKIFGKPYH
jgi:hypothetical protein